MATEDYVRRAIESSKTYEELPPRVRSLLPATEFKAKYALLMDRSASEDLTCCWPDYDSALNAHFATGSRNIAFREASAGKTL